MSRRDRGNVERGPGRAGLTALAALILVLLAVPSGGASGRETLAGPDKPSGPSGPRPNVVLVVTDDMTKADWWRVAPLRDAAGGGTFFHEAFVTTALCCPSRATTLTGLYAHNHGVTRHIGPGTGHDAYAAGGHERDDLASWLRGSGYETVLVGKYLNRYDAGEDRAPPGWSEWYAADTPGESWRLDENGDVRRYQQEDPGAPGYRYWEDVLGDKAVSFLENRAPSGKPFFMWYGTHAPHSPEIVAPRHEDAFAGAPLPRPPSFDEGDVSDKPRWIRTRDKLGPNTTADLKEKHRNRLRGLLAVADNLRRLKAALARAGELDETYFVFTSDNGYHMGQHRLGPGKMSAYEEDIRVPLAVEGPGVPSGGVRHLTPNTDLAPTIADLAGVTAPRPTDGRSFAPLLRRGGGNIPAPEWRRRFMVENWRGPIPGGTWPAPTNRAVRTPDALYNRYANGEREFYDLDRDPFELNNEAETLSEEKRRRLDGHWQALAGCEGAECHRAEGGRMRGPTGPPR